MYLVVVVAGDYEQVHEDDQEGDHHSYCGLSLHGGRTALPHAVGRHLRVECQSTQHCSKVIHRFDVTSSTGQCYTFAECILSDRNFHNSKTDLKIQKRIKHHLIGYAWCS